MPDEDTLQFFSQGEEVAFFVLQQLEHKYQFSSAEILFLTSVNERFTKDKTIMIEVVIFLIKD